MFLESVWKSRIPICFIDIDHAVTVLRT